MYLIYLFSLCIYVQFGFIYLCTLCFYFLYWFPHQSVLRIHNFILSSSSVTFLTRGLQYYYFLSVYCFKLTSSTRIAFPPIPSVMDVNELRHLLSVAFRPYYTNFASFPLISTSEFSIILGHFLSAPSFVFNPRFLSASFILFGGETRALCGAGTEGVEEARERRRKEEGGGRRRRRRERTHHDPSLL